jgi:hypothetical protein
MLVSMTKLVTESEGPRLVLLNIRPHDWSSGSATHKEALDTLRHY